MIICFSGTGNSLLVARQLQSHLGGDILMLEGRRLIEPDSELIRVPEGEPVVWVMPVYSWGIPPVVVPFLRRSRLKITPEHSTPHFLVLTCGDDTGYADHQWAKIIGRRGWNPRGSFSVIMPNTYVLMKGFDVDTPEVADAKLKAMPDRVAHIAAKISKGYGEGEMTRGSWAWLKTYIIYPWFAAFCMSPAPSTPPPPAHPAPSAPDPARSPTSPCPPPPLLYPLVLLKIKKVVLWPSFSSASRAAPQPSSGAPVAPSVCAATISAHPAPSPTAPPPPPNPASPSIADSPSVPPPSLLLPFPNPPSKVRLPASGEHRRQSPLPFLLSPRPPVFCSCAAGLPAVCCPEANSPLIICGICVYLQAENYVAQPPPGPVAALLASLSVDWLRAGIPFSPFFGPRGAARLWGASAGLGNGK